MKKELEVTVLTEHHEGEKYWSASVPLIEGCLAEGKTPQEAAQNIIPEIKYFIEHYPNLVEDLKKEPEFELINVKTLLTDS